MYVKVFILILVSCFISLFVCEVILIISGFPLGLEGRVFLPFWLNQPGVGLRLRQTLQGLEDPQKLYSVYEYDKEHGIRLKKNVNIDVKTFGIPDKEIETKLSHWRLATNKLHYRIWSNGKTPEDDNLLLILGGSSPFGWGVDFEDSFPAIMAKQENKPAQVMNLSVPGYSIFDSWLLYKEYRKMIRNKKSFRLIIDGGSNNLGLSSTTDKEAYRYRLSWEGKTRFLLSQLRLYWLVKGFLNQHGYFIDKLDKIRVPYVEYRGLLESLLKMAIEDGGNVTIINMCNNDKRLIDIMKEMASKYKVDFFDSNLYFEQVIELIRSGTFSGYKELTQYYNSLYGYKRLEKNPRWMLEFHMICHPNKLGQMLIAEELERRSSLINKK